MNKDIQETLDANIRFNRFWNRAPWEKNGFQWVNGDRKNPYTVVPKIVEKFLYPHLDEKFDLDILEIACGAGRLTADLLRIAKTLHLVDLNQTCIDLCKKRFEVYKNIQYHVNDGKSLPDCEVDLVISYDSFVHMSMPVIESYMREAHRVLRDGGVMWFDHHGMGTHNKGGLRTPVSVLEVRETAIALGFKVVAQDFKNKKDCITVLRK